MLQSNNFYRQLFINFAKLSNTLLSFFIGWEHNGVLTFGYWTNQTNPRVLLGMFVKYSDDVPACGH